MEGGELPLSQHVILITNQHRQLGVFAAFLPWLPCLLLQREVSINPSRKLFPATQDGEYSFARVRERNG